MLAPNEIRGNWIENYKKNAIRSTVIRRTQRLR